MNDEYGTNGVDFNDALDTIEDTLGPAAVDDLIDGLQEGNLESRGFTRRLVKDIAWCLNRWLQRRPQERKPVGPDFNFLMTDIGLVFGRVTRKELVDGQVDGSKPELGFDEQLLLDLSDVIGDWVSERLLK